MKAHVTPLPGRTVLIPGTTSPLPAEGLEVEYGVHWARRAIDGDVRVEFIQDALARAPAAPTPTEIRHAPELEAAESTRTKPNPKKV